LVLAKATPTRNVRTLSGAQSEKGAAAPRRWPSGHLQPQCTQRLALSLQLAAVQQLLLGQQPLIKLIDSLELGDGAI
jgi:hypothetical protein